LKKVALMTILQQSSKGFELCQLRLQSTDSWNYVYEFCHRYCIIVIQLLPIQLLIVMFYLIFQDYSCVIRNTKLICWF
jgi:hypothetical protein